MNSSLKLFVLSGEDEKLVIHSVLSFVYWNKSFVENIAVIFI